VYSIQPSLVNFFSIAGLSKGKILTLDRCGDIGDETTKIKKIFKTGFLKNN